MTTHPPLIAIVDDDASVRKALTRLLQVADYLAVAYSSAEEFLTAFATRVPACILVDYQLPKMTGLDLQLHLREYGICTPVIIITPHNEITIRERCINLGASAFLAKPVGKKELLAAIRHSLTAREPCSAPEQ
jgi:FixJ family two-component response regulator